MISSLARLREKSDSRHSSTRHRGFQSADELIGCSNDELAAVDPLEMNLLVAKGIPSLAHLNIETYQEAADGWAEDIRSALATDEKEFWKAPQDWKNDINFFRLGVMCWYVDT